MCGVTGVIGFPNAAKYNFLMLYLLQHRGQDSCGITTLELPVIKGLGLVSEVFKDDQISRKLPGTTAAGQVRYATQGRVLLENAAPFERSTSQGMIKLVHNGHIINYESLKDFLKKKGIPFQGVNDGELMLNLLAYKLERNGFDYVKAIRYAMTKVKGAFSIVLLTPRGIFAFCDHHAFRPLVIGRKEKAFFVASETCALDICHAKFVKMVKPGEIVFLRPNRMISYNGHKARPRHCVFEHVYFAYPASTVFGIPVEQFRERMGKRMGELFRPQLDEILGQYAKDKIAVIPVPDTANLATKTFCRELGLQDNEEIGLIRSHYTGRTFIRPEQRIRDLQVSLKFSVIRRKVEGKIVILIDDSIVRGSTLRKIVRKLKAAGALKIYVVIYSPQICGSCHMGIDTPNNNELIANTKGSSEKVAHFLGADFLLHCQVDDLKLVIASFGKKPEDYCYACFNRKYPFRVPKFIRKD